LWYGVITSGKLKDHVKLQYLAFDAEENTYVLSQSSGKASKSAICGNFGKRVFDVKNKRRIMRDMFSKEEIHDCTINMQNLFPEKAQTERKSSRSTQANDSSSLTRTTAKDANATENRGLPAQCDPDHTSRDLNTGAALVSTTNILKTKRTRNPSQLGSTPKRRDPSQPN
jgi:hypothetical protein